MCDSGKRPSPLNSFAFKLLHHLKDTEPQKNIVCSPYSVSSAMSMVLLGAQGTTKLELEKALCVASTMEVHESAKAMQEALKGKNVDESLDIANNLFLEMSFQVKEEFSGGLKGFYESSVSPQNFKESPEASRKNINGWVHEKTHGKIEDLLPPNSISRDTRLVLANAIYFKGMWASQFDKSKTTAQDFHVTDNRVVKVEMMRKKSKYGLSADSNGKVMMIELPYQGLPVSMLILLPTRNLAEVERVLDAQMFETLYNSLSKEEVIVGVPKFKLEFEKDLCDAFEKFGAKSVFTESANFKGISDTERLAISAIAHKAFIAVDEEGTEAAAATAVIMTRMALLPTTEFICNKPFLFLLYHKTTKTILFTGRILDPTA